MKQVKQSFPASLDALHEMVDFVCKNVIEAGLKENMADNIELATEEVLVNIIKHGIDHSENQRHLIDIECKPLKNPSGIEIIISDPGIAFNPLTYKVKPSTGIPIDQMPIGGHGIFLIRKLMDRVSYRRYGEKNELTLTKFAVKPSD